MAHSKTKALMAGSALAAATAFSSHAAAQSFLIDLGPSGPSDITASPDANGNTWNNFAPGSFIRLEDTSGALSAAADGLGIGFGATTGLGASGGVGNGLENPDAGFLGDFAIVSATIDYCFRFDDPNDANDDVLGFEFSNLDTNLTYNIRVFACRLASTTREVRFTATGGNGAVSGDVVVGGPNIGSNGMSFGNDNVIVELNGVTPTGAGVISLEGDNIQDNFVYFNVVEIAVAEPVAITAQPESSIVDAGGTLTFTATAEPAGAALKWQRDGVDVVDGMGVSGATTDTLTITDAGIADAGIYTLVATEAGSSATSDGAIGAVRASSIGVVDFDNNGVLDFFDVLAFIDAFDAAGG